LVRALDLAADVAVEVISLDPNGPAARAGVRVDDIVLAVNGKAVTHVDDLHRLLSDGVFGVPVQVSLLRRTQRLDVTVTPEEAVP
jgi:S1-C subfamily serine protease